MQTLVGTQADEPGVTEATVTPTAEPQAAPIPTRDDARAAALAAISDDPAVRSFYDRVVPTGITPEAWIPFWPSAWVEAQ